MSSKLANYFHQNRLQMASVFINVSEVRQSVDELVCLLFPQRACLGPKAEKDIDELLNSLKQRFTVYFEAVSALNPKNKGKDEELATQYLESLPQIAEILDLDAAAAFKGDPAAYSLEEVIITYPGFYAIAIHRLAHALYTLNIPLIPRLMCEYAHEKTGIDIHPGANIGESFFIDHGTGVVIGETSIIGKRVKIYQGVTLGALSVKKRLQSIKRHPTIEDEVVIYANATILGGETTVGEGSVIGGNVWLTESLPPGSVAFNKQEINLGNK